MTPTLAVWTQYYNGLSPEDAIREFKRHGIYASELSYEHGRDLLGRGEPRRVGRDFARFLHDEGYTVTQGHLWHDCYFCERAEHYDELLRWLLLYDAIGIKNCVLHADAIKSNKELTDAERWDINCEKLSAIADFIKENKLSIRICLENLKRFSTTVEELNAVIDRLDSDIFGICLDTSHLHVCGGDQREFILAAGSRLHALHIGDNEGERDQHMMPFSRGNIDFTAVMTSLRDVGYDGLYNMEIPGENLAPIEVRGYKLDFIRKSYEYLCEVTK